MPTSSSDSEGTTQRPRRRSAARSASSEDAPSAPTRRRRTATESASAPAAAEATDDFGSGLDNEPAPPRETRPRRTRRTTATTAEPESSQTAPAAVSSTAPASTAADSDDSPRPLRRSRLDRGSRRSSTSRSSSENDSPAADSSSESSRSDDSSDRISNRLERKIADVEAETGMRYFSTDDLDFGDDEPAPRDRDRDADRRPPRPDRRDRRRHHEPDSYDQSESTAEPSSAQEYSRGRDDFADWGDQLFGSDGPDDGPHDGAALDDSSSGPDGDHGDADGRRRRRRRRRRRGGERFGNDRIGGERFGDRPPGDRPPGDPNARFEQRGDQAPPRFDGPGRREFGRFDGGPGRNRRGRNRRGPDQFRGGPPGGPRPGFGRDRGPAPSRRPAFGATPLPVIEGTFDGVLEVHHRGYGFLRDPKRNYASDESNPFVPTVLMEKFGLREGVLIRAQVGAGSHHHGPRVHEIELIDGMTPGEYSKIRIFDELTAINPFEQIRLETGPKPLTMRVMDLLCPIGKGQRSARRSTPHRQNHAPPGHRSRRQRQPSRNPPDGAADRRTPRRGHRNATPRQRRSHLVLPR